jgi:hypothetical protein
LLGQKAEVNPPFTCRNLAKLAGLPTETPQPRTLAHFFLGCCRVVEERIRLQYIIAKRM